MRPNSETVTMTTPAPPKCVTVVLEVGLHAKLPVLHAAVCFFKTAAAWLKSSAAAALSA